MHITYEEAASETITISRKRALRELDKHGACHEEFFAELGDRLEYTSKEVLTWLGY